MTSLNMVSQEINPEIKPEPLADIQYPFPNYEVEKLKNGLKVFLIEDKEQPTIAFRILIKGGSSLDGDKSGLSELTSGLLTKGTKKFSAEQIANKLDGVGASVYANSGADFITIYAQSLKKHQPLLLEVLTDALINPTFPNEEFEKLQKQMIAGIQYEKSNPSSLAQQLARVALYGKEHPYSKVNSENSVSSITLDDVKNYFNTWFKVNNASIAVIGDFKKADILKDLEKYFAKWEKAKVPEINIPNPKTMTRGVYFISRPGSVQSSVVVTTLTVPYLSRDYEKLNLAANILGAFSGRLFSTLREKHSLTYSPYGFQTRTKYSNRFAAGADVTGAKTDQAIQVILDELRRLNETEPDAKELDRIRQYTLGSYLMSLESGSFVASLIQNTDFYGAQIYELQNFPTRLNSLSTYDMKDVSNDFINPDNALIVVVGSPEIRESLSKFGQVFDYDMDLETQDGPNAKLEKVNISAEKLIKYYTDAIGGNKNIEAVNSIVIKGTSDMSISGQLMTGEVYSIKTKEGKMYQKSDFRVFENETWVIDKEAYLKIDGHLIKMENEDKSDLLLESYPFPLMNFDELELKAEVLGRNSKHIVLLVTDKLGAKTRLYFNKDNYLLEKKEIMTKGPAGEELFTMKYENYKEFGNVKLPSTIISQASQLNTTNKFSYEINQQFDENIFNIKSE